MINVTELFVISMSKSDTAVLFNMDLFMISICHILKCFIKVLNNIYFIKMFTLSPPGNIETGSMSRGVLSRNVALRNELDLYTNVLHCKSYPGVTARQKDIDIIIVRQNIEGEYAMLEHEVSAFLC